MGIYQGFIKLLPFRGIGNGRPGVYAHFSCERFAESWEERRSRKKACVLSLQVLDRGFI